MATNNTDENVLNSCCVCLCFSHSLIKLTTSNDESNLVTKLRSCVIEIDWLESYLICQNCRNQLEVAYSFRVLCFQSHEKRQKTISEGTSKFKSKDSFLHARAVETRETVEIKPENDGTYISEDDGNICSDENDQIIVKTKAIRAKRNINFVCDVCRSTFNSSIKLIKHCVTIHKLGEKDVKPFACSKCSNKFQRSSNLHQHMKYHDGTRNHICAYCGRGFVAKCDLAIHEKQHLNKREYQCPFCPKSFNTHKDLRSHKLVVHTDPSLWSYVCNVCHKRFPIKSNYDSHMRRHNNDKPFACHLCVKRFSDKCVLQKHMRSHSDIRAYKCKECHKEYKDQRVMELHMAKIHNLGDIKLPEKVKKFFCHMCPKSFFIKSRLTRHIYSHSGEKPFMCSLCEKRFSDKSYMKIHMKSAHNFIEEITAL